MNIGCLFAFPDSPRPPFRLCTSRRVKVTPVFDRPCGATLTCSFKMMCNSQVGSSTHLFLSGVPTAGRREGPGLTKVPWEL